MGAGGPAREPSLKGCEHHVRRKVPPHPTNTMYILSASTEAFGCKQPSVSHWGSIT